MTNMFTRPTPRKPKENKDKSPSSGGGGGSAPKTGAELFQEKLREENIINTGGQIRQEKLGRYRELYNQYVKQPGDYETYKREGFVPGTNEEQAYNRLMEAERSFVEREKELNKNQVVILGELNKTVDEQQKKEIAIYTRLYGRPSLSQEEPGGSVRADFYGYNSPSNSLTQEEVTPEVLTPYSFPEPDFSDKKYFGPQDIRQTRSDLGPSFFEVFPKADFSGAYFGTYTAVSDNPDVFKLGVEGSVQEKTDFYSSQFIESSRALQGDLSFWETVDNTGKFISSVPAYVQASATLGAVRFGGNLVYLATKPGESLFSLADTSVKFVADSKERNKIISSSIQKFNINPIAYVTEAGLNIAGPEIAIKGVKGVKGNIAEARFNAKIRASESILTDPRRLDYLDPESGAFTFKAGSGTEAVPGKAYVQYEPGVQLNLYGKSIPDETISATVPDYGPSPLNLPKNYYSGLDAFKVLDEGVKKIDVQKPVLQQTFTVADRLTGKVYTKVPGDAQVIQNYFKEGSPRFLDDPLNFGDTPVKGISREGLQRFEVYPDKPPSSYLGEQTKLVKDTPGEQLIISGETLNLKYYDPIKNSFTDTIPPKAPRTDLNKLVYSTVPGASAFGQVVEKGVSVVAELKLKSRSSVDPGSSLRSVPVTPLSLTPLGLKVASGSLLSIQEETELQKEKPLQFEPALNVQNFQPALKTQSDTLIKSVVIEETKTKQKEDQSLILIPSLRIGTRQITEQTLKIDNKPINPDPIIPPPPPPIDGELWFPDDGGKVKLPVPAKRPKDESVFVGRSRGFVAINIRGDPISPVLSREGALNYGASVIDRTALRSFNIKEVNQNPVNMNVQSGFNPSKFYTSKKGFFTEKSSFAIDTPGEYSEISFKGLLSLGNRNKRSVFNKKYKGGKNGIF